MSNVAQDGDRKTRGVAPIWGKYFAVLSIGVLGALAVVLTKNPFFADMVIMTMFYASLGLAWNIVGGFCGQLSLGHTVFFGIGGYTASLLLLKLGVSPWIGMLLGGFFSAIVGFLLGVTTLRLEGPYFTLATLALGEIFLLLSHHFEHLTGGAVGLVLPREVSFTAMSFQGKEAYGFFVLIFLVVMTVICQKIRVSKLGFYFIALKDEESSASALGVGRLKYKTLAFVISAFFTSVGGSFYACYLHYADPDVMFSIHHSIQFAMVAIIGGTGTVFGPVLGAALITPVDSLLKAYLGGQMQGLSLLVYGVILIVVVLFMPNGIMPWLTALGKKRFRRLRPEAKGPLREPIGVEVVAPDQGTRDETALILEVTQISKAFGGLQAVQDVNLAIRQNEIVGIIGPNGAGKTTLFNLISRSQSVDSGSIFFRSTDITGINDPAKVCKLGLSRTFQIPKPFQSLKVLDNIAVAAYCHVTSSDEAIDYAESITEFVGLSSVISNEIRTLTIAQLKRLELAKALATKPSLLLLDEVMTGLTPSETDTLVDLVRKISESGVTLLLIEHVMRAIMKLSNRIIVLNYGKLIGEGSPKEIAGDPKVVEAYLGKARGALYARGS